MTQQQIIETFIHVEEEKEKKRLERRKPKDVDFMAFDPEWEEVHDEKPGISAALMVMGLITIAVFTVIGLIYSLDYFNVI